MRGYSPTPRSWEGSGVIVAIRSHTLKDTTHAYGLIAIYRRLVESLSPIRGEVPRNLLELELGKHAQAIIDAGLWRDGIAIGWEQEVGYHEEIAEAKRDRDRQRIAKARREAKERVDKAPHVAATSRDSSATVASVSRVTGPDRTGPIDTELQGPAEGTALPRITPPGGKGAVAPFGVQLPLPTITPPAVVPEIGSSREGRRRAAKLVKTSPRARRPPPVPHPDMPPGQYKAAILASILDKAKAHPMAAALRKGLDTAGAECFRGLPLDAVLQAAREYVKLLESGTVPAEPGAWWNVKLRNLSARAAAVAAAGPDAEVRDVRGYDTTRRAPPAGVSKAAFAEARESLRQKGVLT